MDRLLKSDRLAEALRLPTTTVRRLARNGIIPCYRIGGRGLMRFNLEEVMETLER